MKSQPLIPFEVIPTVNPAIDSSKAINVENSTWLNLSIELPVSNTKQPSENAVNDARILASNSWADIAEVEEETNRALHINKTGKKSTKNVAGVRTRRRHVSKPLSS